MTRRCEDVERPQFCRRLDNGIHSSSPFYLYFLLPIFQSSYPVAFSKITVLVHYRVRE